MTETDSSRRLFTVLFYGVILLLFYLVFRIFEPFLVPLGWAVVLVVCFYPLHERLVKRWGATRAAVMSTAGVALVLVVPALVLLGGFVREGMLAAQALEKGHGAATEASFLATLERGLEWVRQHVPGAANFDPDHVLRQAGQWVGGFLAAEAGAVLRNAALFLLDLFVMLFALFFLFRDADSIIEKVRRTLPFEEAHRAAMLAQARDLIFASVTASLVISLIQGFIGGVSFALVGLPTPLFWGGVMAFFALLPLIGSWIIWVPSAIWLFAQGRIGGGLFLIALCGVAAGVLDHFVRPLLLSGRAQMSSFIVFISVLGGIAVFGMLGLVLGPIVVATAAGVLEAYTAREAVGTERGGMVESGAGKG